MKMFAGYVRLSPRHDWQKDTTVHVGRGGAMTDTEAADRVHRVSGAHVSTLRARGVYSGAEYAVRAAEWRGSSTFPDTVKRGAGLPGEPA